MEELSGIGPLCREPVAVPVAPYLLDHRVEGRAVLPAVAAMSVLAETVRARAPEVRVETLADARFERFLFLEAGTLSAVIEHRRLSGGRMQAVLTTPFQAKTSGILRYKSHVSLIFGDSGPTSSLRPVPPPKAPPGPAREIAPERIYADCVPFGPAFHTLSGNLALWERRALARVRGGPEDGEPGPLGSLFPLDAAFHVACVWGQRYARIVAFPVGFDRREIVRPTRPGREYLAVVAPVRWDLKRLVMDIGIYDPDGGLMESVSGLDMRDVSAGRMKPPAWIVQ